MMSDNSQSVLTLVEVRDNSPPFILTTIYASPSLTCRKVLWSDLYDISKTD